MIDAPFAPSPSASASSVSVIINTYNDAEYLSEAIESVLAQTARPAEIIVVDDGSDVDPTPKLIPYPQVRLVRQSNSGLAAARNRGLAEARSEYIVFLDADDRLRPTAIEAGLACHARTPDAALVYGGHRCITADGRPLGSERFDPVGSRPFLDLLRGNVIGMHASVLYRTDLLKEAGGFDSSLRRCEDYDLYLRLSRSHPVGCHPAIITEYRWHERNMSHDIGRMLETVLRVHARHRDDGDAEVRRAWKEGRHNWRKYYAEELALSDRAPSLLLALSQGVLLASPRSALRAITRKGLRAGRGLARRLGRSAWPPRVGKVRLGDLASTRPVSLTFGFDRGLPIDRCYIEGFLELHAVDIQGRVLEVGDDAYSRRFGGDRISQQEILHIHHGNPLATIVGDITDPTVLVKESFDCMVLTQTLHLIYDFHTAVARIFAALRPGGVALITVPGITPVDRDEWGETWHWAFTRTSILRVFTEAFGSGEVTVTHYGNVFAATAFLHGLAVSEVDRQKLDVVDNAYPVILGVRARKAG